MAKSNLREVKSPVNKKKDETLKKELIHHRRMIWIRSILVIVVLAGIAMILFLQWKNKIYTTYETIDSIEKQEISSSNILDFSGTPLIYSDDGIHCIDLTGETLWNQTYEMQNPIINISGDYVAVADYNGKDIYVMNKSEIVSTFTTTMPIHNIVVSQEGITAVVMDDGSTTYIYIYRETGDIIAYFVTTMEQSGYPQAIAISPNSEIVAVSFLHEDMSSSIAFYNFGEVGQNESSDNLVSGYEYADMVVPVIGFLDDETSYALGDNRLMFYGGSEKPASKVELILNEEVKSFYSENGYLVLIFVDTSEGDKYRAEIYDTEGELVLSQTFNLDYTGIRLENNGIILYNQQECVYFNMDGVEKFSGSFDKQVQLIIPTSLEHKWTLVGGDFIDTIELK